MGMQVYERAIDARADMAFDTAAPGATIQRIVVRSVRAPLTGNRRLPMRAVWRAPARVRREIGRGLYPGRGPVHRLDLTLPPSPHGDIITVHDLAPLRFDDEGRLPPAAREELVRASAVITVSTFSAGELTHLLGAVDPIVIPNGVDHDRFVEAHPLDETQLQALGIRAPYVLAAGGASSRKNLKGLAQAWQIVRGARPDVELVLTGPPHPRRDALFAEIPGVVRVGRVHDDVLPRLLAGCRALAIASLYEGFGLPAIEGMAAGVPVVAMDAGALPEVVGETAVLADGTAGSLAEGILWALSDDRVIRDKVAAARRRSLDFTWERSAEAHARVWADVIAGRNPCRVTS